MNKPEDMLVVGSADKQKVAEALALHMVRNDGPAVIEVGPSATIRDRQVPAPIQRTYVIEAPEYHNPALFLKPDNRVWLPPPGADRHSKKRKY